MDLPFSVDEEVRNFVKNNFLKDNKESIERIIQYLRDRNFSQMQTVFLLMKEVKISIGEANRFVLNSKTWSGNS
jgi:hypothetical protein